jgi:hypothetical protein
VATAQQGRGRDLNTSARTANQHESLLEDPTASDPTLRVSGVQARAQRHASARPQVSPVEAGVLISLGAPAEPALLEPTCTYLAAYCDLCLPPQITQRLNVAIYELYANGLRYGSRADEVRLELAKTARGVRLSVSNRAEKPELERLVAHLERVKADPEAAFSNEMNRFASGSQPAPMVGLVRIAHECKLVLELELHDDRVVLSTLCEI